MNEEGDWMFKGAHRTYFSPCSNLNVMHEVENVLTKDQRSRFINELTLPMVWHDENGIGWFAAHATARQRAEAFLKTIGKWSECPAA
jgi:hypothetical protein